MICMFSDGSDMLMNGNKILLIWSSECTFIIPLCVFEHDYAMINKLFAFTSIFGACEPSEWIVLVASCERVCYKLELSLTTK